MKNALVRNRNTDVDVYALYTPKAATIVRADIVRNSWYPVGVELRFAYDRGGEQSYAVNIGNFAGGAGYLDTLLTMFNVNCLSDLVGLRAGALIDASRNNDPIAGVAVSESEGSDFLLASDWSEWAKTLPEIKYPTRDT